MLINLNENYITVTVFVRKFAFRRCGLQLHISLTSDESDDSAADMAGSVLAAGVLSS